MNSEITLEQRVAKLEKERLKVLLKKHWINIAFIAYMLVLAGFAIGVLFTGLNRQHAIESSRRGLVGSLLVNRPVQLERANLTLEVELFVICVFIALGILSFIFTTKQLRQMEQPSE